MRVGFRHATGLLHCRRRTLVAVGLLLLLSAAAAVWYGWTESRLRAAERALENHDSNEARRLLAQCLKWRPRWGRAHFLAARAARCEHHYNEAEQHLKACERQDYNPEPVAIERLLANVQLGDAQPVQALQALVEEDNPHSLAILEVLTQFYLDNYQLMRALDCLNRYLRQRPDDLRALLGRGFVHERLHHFPEARDDYRRAVRAHPDSDAARLRLAKVLEVVGPASEALGQYRNLEQRQPDDPEVLLGLARSNRQLSQQLKCREYLGRLLELRSEHPEGLAERGLVELDAGRTVQAERWLRRAIRADPHNRVAHDALYRCLRRQGKEEDARQVRQKFDRLDAALKRLDFLLTRAVPQAPDDASLRCEAGLLFLHHGQEAEGVRWLRLALRCDPGHETARRELAAYYERKRQAQRPPSPRSLPGPAPGP
jgi:tetratricopeptide (TPR) repeat protein